MLKLSFIIFCVVTVVLYPVLLIWSVNTLFNTEIPINLYTYIAGLLLSKPFRDVYIKFGDS